MSKKNKQKKLIKSRKNRLKRLNPELYEQKRREGEYLKASIERLNEYSINIRRDKNDPLWEYSSEEKF